MRRGNVLATAVAVLVPALASAQGVEIDHKAVGCIVVGKFPKMNACLTPAANVARARVYFRPEGTPSWYYVDMKSDQPCFSGVLPKPGKKLVGKKIEYYVETQDKTFNAARTAEYGPTVVRSAQECKKQVPVAPFLNNASVAVFPGVPAGFVGGGLGTAAVVGVAAAGAAAAGTAAVVATNNNNNDTTTTTTPVASNSTTTTLAPVVTTTTTTTTTQTPRANRAPVAVLTTTPDPPSGPDPLTVAFDLCKSTDPDGDPLNFFFTFGDGGTSSGTCLVSHTYSGTLRGTAQVRKADRSYNAEACAVDPSGASQCRTRTVSVTTPPPSTLPCGNPTISLAKPKNNDTVVCDVSVVASTTDTDSVTACAESSPCGSLTAAQQAAIGAAASAAQPPTCRALGQSGSTFSGSIPLPGGFGCFQVTATATNNCGGGTDKAGPVQVFNSCGSAIRKGEGTAAVWSSDLKLDGGRLQVVVNGDGVTYPERGRTFGTSRLRTGENRMEATVVEAAGRAGSWRIDLSGSEAVEVGSLRVIAGEVESVTSNAITFRLKGFAGERVAFSFVNKR